MYGATYTRPVHKPSITLDLVDARGLRLSRHTLCILRRTCSTVLAQSSDDGILRICFSDFQCRHSTPFLHRGVSSQLDQRFTDVRMAVHGCPDQRRHTLSASLFIKCINRSSSSDHVSHKARVSF